MSSKITLTTGRIEKAACPTGSEQSFLWDDEAKGLGLRVTKAGAKSFIYQGKLGGKTIRTTIGSVDAWPIESVWQKDDSGKRSEVRRGAREESRRLQGLVDQGIDPREHEKEKQAERQAVISDAKQKNITVGEVWQVYLDARKAKWGERHFHDHLSLASAGGLPRKVGKGLTMPGPLAPLMPLKIAELDANCIAAWLEAESATRPTNTEQSFRKLRSFLRWAADRQEYKKVVRTEVLTTSIVKDAVPKVRAKEGDCLQREQLPTWFGAVRKLRNPVIVAYLQALLLTGARREEMAALQWKDVDFQWRKITIRDKVEGTRDIPLTPYLSTLLTALPRRNEWVFSSPAAESGRLTEPRIAHNEALRAAGLPHVTLHGLRRSFGTLCEWVEMPSGISAQIMGHKPSALAEKHYRRRPLDLLRKWHDTIEVWIIDQAGIKF